MTGSLIITDSYRKPKEWYAECEIVIYINGGLQNLRIPHILI